MKKILKMAATKQQKLEAMITAVVVLALEEDVPLAALLLLVTDEWERRDK